MAARLLSAAIGIPVVVGAVWYGAPWLTALVALAALAAYWELHRLADGATGAAPPLLHGLLFTLVLVLDGHWEAGHTLSIVTVGLLSSLVWQVARGVRPQTAAEWAMSMAAPIYIGAPLSYALLLRAGEAGREWLLLTLLATFATDSGAFFVGRLLGRHAMAPTISPKKTWEGAAGGLVAGAGAVVALVPVLGLAVAWWLALAVGAVLAVAAQAGDLGESLLKRALHAGEAGRLIPGHGGVLDRLDSIVFTLVVMYHIVVWVIS